MTRTIILISIKFNEYNKKESLMKQKNIIDEQYLFNLKCTMYDGAKSKDRTNTGTRSTFGTFTRIDISERFPLINCKRTHFKSIIEELLWFISGSTNVKDLQARGVTIWDEWADPETGELNEVYGKQWSRYEDIRIIKPKDVSKFQSRKDYSEFTRLGSVCLHILEPIGVAYRREINQIERLVERLKSDPYSRRHILNAWNVQTVDEAALPPCHVLYQFYVRDGYLSCMLYQRSNDAFLGKPFNIASAAALTYMLAQQCGLKPLELIHVVGDDHIYENHLPQTASLLMRESVIDRPSPILKLKKAKSIMDYKFEDFDLKGYNPEPSIRADVAV